MKKKLFGATILLAGLAIALGLIVMQPMQDPPTYGMNSVTTHTVC